MNLAIEFEQTIRQNRSTAVDAILKHEDFVLPHYAGYSIANLGLTIAGLLGKAEEGPIAEAQLEPALPHGTWVPLAGGVTCVVVVVLDAVGYVGFRRLLEAEETVFSRLARTGRLVPLTSVFPSTTMAAMSSIWTGRAPANHGFLGRRLFLSEVGFVADMIRLMPALHGTPGSLVEWGWVPEAFIPVPHLAQLLSAVGVRAVAHLYGPHIGGGLSRLFMRGVELIEGYLNYSDMWINVRESVVQRGDAPLLVNVYWAGTDDLSHKYGPEDERLGAAVRQIAASFERDFLAPLSPAAREGTVVIITADHGQVETPPQRAVHLADHPELKEMLLWPPCGEPRASYLHLRPGAKGRARDYVVEHLSDRLLAIDVDLAIEAGLFGRGGMPVGSRHRVGDLLLLARDDSRLIPTGATADHKGEHGSLRPEEMLVPLLMARLDG
jgi:hypothetical protein